VNVSHITTNGGEVKIAAMTANVLDVNANGGPVSLYEVFIGLNAAFNMQYPPPAINVVTGSGTITGLGCGATPGANAFANELDMSFVTDSGDIKVSQLPVWLLRVSLAR